MYKCTKCGAEFDGDICPVCGEKRAEGRICPQCKAIAEEGARFCPQCGYDLRGEKTVENVPAPIAAESNADGFVKKLYSAMRVLPSVIIAAFTLLFLVFCLGGVGKISAMGIEQSLGSVYKAASNGSGSLKTTLAFLIVFDIATLVFAAVDLCFSFIRSLKPKALDMGKRGFLSFTDIFSAVAVLALIVILITASVACLQLNASVGLPPEAKELGITVAPSAGLILVMVFSVIFALLAAACPIGRYLIGKFFPAYREEEQKYFERSYYGDYGLDTEEGRLKVMADVKKLQRRQKGAAVVVALSVCFAIYLIYYVVTGVI